MKNRYWLDANVLIQANRISYPYAIAKTFWMRLAGLIESERVVSPRRVYQELTEHEKHQDFVRDFVMPRRKQLCITPDALTQKWVREIETYIFSSFQSDEAWKFSKGGDPWVIAHAKADDGFVVTHESADHPLAQRPLIPNICREFSVPCVNTMGMFTQLKATF